MGWENVLPVHSPCPSSWYWKCQETSYSFPVENYTALLTLEYSAAEQMLWSAFLHHLRIVRVQRGVRLTPTAFSLTYVDELNYKKKKKCKPQKNLNCFQCCLCVFTQSILFAFFPLLTSAPCCQAAPALLEPLSTAAAPAEEAETFSAALQEALWHGDTGCGGGTAGVKLSARGRKKKQASPALLSRGKG